MTLYRFKSAFAAIAGAFALAALAAPAIAQPIIGGDLDLDLEDGGEVTIIAADVNLRGTIGGDLDALAADMTINASIGGDANIAAADISVAGSVGGELNAAAADITIDAGVGGDVNAAGANITLNGATGQDLSAAGALVTFAGSASVGGDAEIAGREAEMAGVIGGDLEARVRELTITGQIAGDAEIKAETLRIGPDAVIGGALSVRGPNEPEIAEGASIAGGVDYEFADFESERFGEFDGVNIDFDVGPPSWAFGGAFAVSAFVLGALAALIAPRSVGGIASTFRRRPWVSGLLGLVVLAFSPIIILTLFVLLAITIVGLPLGLILLLAFPVLLFLAYAFGGIAVGDIIFNRSGGRLGLGWRILSLFIVLAAIGALSIVPVIGWVLGPVVLCIGLGAWTIAIFGRSNGNGGEAGPAAVAAAGTTPAS